jgi:hypothetical protein
VSAFQLVCRNERYFEKTGNRKTEAASECAAASKVSRSALSVFVQGTTNEEHQGGD